VGVCVVEVLEGVVDVGEVLLTCCQCVANVLLVVEVGEVELPAALAAVAAVFSTPPLTNVFSLVAVAAVFSTPPLTNVFSLAAGLCVRLARHSVPERRRIHVV